MVTTNLKLRCCVAGPPLHETIKLLAPLTNLENLGLGGNKLGGTITADVASFTKLESLGLNCMGLDGKPLEPVLPRYSHAGSIKF